MSQPSSISLPKLESFDWRIDIKSSSNQIHHMNVPTVMVDLKVLYIYNYFISLLIYYFIIG